MLPSSAIAAPGLQLKEHIFRIVADLLCEHLILCR